MAKEIKPIKGPAQEPPEPTKRTTIHAYRVERLSVYEYQCFRTTKMPSGAFIEEPFGKPTLLDLVMRKVSHAIALESNEVFQANKKMLAELEAEKNKATELELD